MAWLFWDASALVKRYTAEIGRDTANALFHGTPPLPMATTLLSRAPSRGSLPSTPPFPPLTPCARSLLE